MHDGRMNIKSSIFLERHVNRNMGVMVIIYRSRSHLVSIRATKDTHRYVDGVMEHQLFQQNNIQAHIVRISLSQCEDTHVNILPSPPRSSQSNMLGILQKKN
ncbi:hypothetical protein Trydic_g1832 [Trypoxylus dichotomus]